MTSPSDTSAVDRARFDEVLEVLRAGAVERERERSAPVAEIRTLLSAGVGAVRVPREFGGAGASVQTLVALLIELGAADSNVPQILRGHFGFVELLRRLPRTSATSEFLAAAGRGEFFGPAASERRGELTEPRTHLVERDGELFLHGEKFYTTGSLYADHLTVLVPWEGTLAEAVVRRDAPGVEIDDDWDGFGQRLTASGTARFDAVAVRRDHVLPYTDAAVSEYVQAFYQLVHTGTQAGIAQRLTEDLAVTVRSRTRRYPTAPVAGLPREDPQVLQVVGEVASGAFAARSTALAVAALFDEYADAADGVVADDALTRAVTASASAQVVNTKLLGELSWTFFDAASSSAVQGALGLDRHWRNARAISSHNPVMYKARAIGEQLVSSVAD